MASAAEVEEEEAFVVVETSIGVEALVLHHAAAVRLGEGMLTPTFPEVPEDGMTAAVLGLLLQIVLPRRADRPLAQHLQYDPDVGRLADQYLALPVQPDAAVPLIQHGLAPRRYANKSADAIRLRAGPDHVADVKEEGIMTESEHRNPTASLALLEDLAHVPPDEAASTEMIRQLQSSREALHVRAVDETEHVQSHTLTVP